jgi:hypothetical protein
MKRTLLIAAVILGAVTAHAGVHVNIGIGFPAWRPPVVVAPPVIVAPASPVCVAPVPVYAPPVYYPPPPRVVCAPAPVIYPRPHGWYYPPAGGVYIRYGDGHGPGHGYGHGRQGHGGRHH